MMKNFLVKMLTFLACIFGFTAYFFLNLLVFAGIGVLGGLLLQLFCGTWIQQLFALCEISIPHVWMIGCILGIVVGIIRLCCKTYAQIKWPQI